MSKQTEALKLALEALEYILPDTPDQRMKKDAAISAIREALVHQDSKEKEQCKTDAFIKQIDEALEEQPAQQEPVANGLPLVIAGAIFDFAGYLTTRDIVIEVGSTANASPVADLVKDWAALRGLSLKDAAVLSWQEWLTDVRANDTSQERVDEIQKHRHDTSPPANANAGKPWVGLTDEDVYPLANAHLRYQPESYEASGIYDLSRAIEAKLREKNA